MNRKHTNAAIIESLPLYTDSNERAGTLIRYSDGTEEFTAKTSSEPKADRNIKDRLFRFIFGDPEHKEWTLALYNFIENTHYTDTNDLQIVTLDNAIYMHMKNDVSVLVGSWNMSFFEHQSTLNPNMPYRFLSYWHSSMERFIEKNKMDIFLNKPIELPVPAFHVIYNGTEKAGKTEKLQLSNLFHKDDSGYNKDRKPSLELIVTQHNINGLKKEESQYCVQLYEYEWFVETIRAHCENVDITTAVNLAINEIPKDFTIRDFILENRSEVVNMSVFEYNEQRHMEKIHAAGKEEGRREGRREERIRLLAGFYEMLRKRGDSEENAISAICEQYDMESEEVREIIRLKSNDRQ